MQDFLSQTFYGNTVSAWAAALGITMGIFLLGKVLNWIMGNVIHKAAARTSSRLDDFVVGTMDKPLVVIFTALGLRIAVETLTLADGLVQFVENAIQATVVLAVTWMIVRFFHAFVRNILQPLAERTDSNLDDQLLPILQRWGSVGIWILGVILALDNAGFDVAAFMAGLGIGGLALAMAAKDTVSNIFGGFTIFADRPFALNDRVRVAGFDGTVTDIGIRSTRLRTLDGCEVTIPNHSFSDSPVENVTREPTRKVVLNLGLTYDTPPEGMRRAMEILATIAEEHAASVTDETRVAFNGYGDFAMNVLFIYYIRKEADILDTQTSVNLAILERFNAGGLEFAFPTQTIYTLTGGS